ncbi:MAG TPA: anti-sigma factor antagonist [Anaerolineaceae bacterium]|jgi:anti-sigma B factor antagonist|nr:anti-sigma factor antagonist [Anaerolineaceae bacterium]
MEIENTQFKHCDLIKVTGRVDSSTAPRLAEAINNILDAGRFKIVLDLTKLEFISSAGLRVLISTQKTCKRYNRGEVVIAGMPEYIKSVFDLAGFTPLFRLFDDSISAVGYF